MPITLLNDFEQVGVGRLMSDAKRSGSGCNVLCEIRYPNKSTTGVENTHFSGLSVRPSFSAAMLNLFKFSSCSS